MPGKPIHRPVVDLERRILDYPTRHIAVEVLPTQLQDGIYYLPVGIYGTHKYFRSVYGAKYGCYGTDVYGDSSYW